MCFSTLSCAAIVALPVKALHSRPCATLVQRLDGGRSSSQGTARRLCAHAVDRNRRGQNKDWHNTNVDKQLQKSCYHPRVFVNLVTCLIDDFSLCVLNWDQEVSKPVSCTS